MKAVVRISYDPDADILYVELRDEEEADVISIGDAEVLVDGEGRPVAIEIWNASKHGLKEIITDASVKV